MFPGSYLSRSFFERGTPEDIGSAGVKLPHNLKSHTYYHPPTAISTSFIPQRIDRV